ncbi:MAG: heavy metal translocating P-type ATPase [Lachnospiraceae bacterium]|nr:heavy metal translocating P-type ATPase [Lachnospiraceae bacterium]
MEQYNVTGMSCAACQARVEKAVSAVPGVKSCAVSLLTNSMGVEGDAKPSDVIEAVEKAGYGASKKESSSGAGKTGAGQYSKEEEALKDKETPVLKKRLAASLVFLIILMYFSMGHMMLGLPLPAFFDGNHVAMGLVQLLLTGIIMVINQKFFVSGFRSMLHLAPNMDSLVALGSGASFVWSVYALFMMTDAQVHSGAEAAMMYMDEFYFESAATILTLITVGKLLEARSKGKTTDALKSLMKLAPQTAVIITNGMEREVPIAEVKKGDVFAVRPGESIPVDGIVIEGVSAVNEAALTGESIPVDKEAGDNVSAATINVSGFLKCEATRVGEDTTLSQIIKMVSDAAATKAPIARLADKVSGVFVPTVIGIAVLTIIVWIIAGQEFSFALARGISVLVISCPCALGLATPVAIMVGNGVGARNGILFKTAESLERTGKTGIIAMDKTGTITKGEPMVTGVFPAEGVTEKEIIRKAAGLEKPSEHPLSKAVTAYAAEKDILIPDVTDFEALPGNGVKATFADGETAVSLSGGSMKYMSTIMDIPEGYIAKANQLSDNGCTPLFFAEDGKLLGVIAVADVIKEDARESIAQLNALGIHTVMITGDNDKTAAAIAAEAGVKDVVANVLPEGKEEKIKYLCGQGTTAMVGDGINDAPALTRADIGIAIGAGTDVAIDAADVVLVKSRLSDVPAAVRLSRATLKNIYENLFWAFIYNIIGIPLAAGVFIPIFGWKLNPMFGAAAMSLSSFCVVSNALRLNLVKLYGKSHNTTNHNTTNIEKENEGMTKTISIEGMMCAHCEATVKKALEALEGVSGAEVSHEKGNAVVTLSKDVDNAVLTKAVEDKEYKVVSVA